VKAIFFGHACLKVYDQSGEAVLMDPWFSRHGAFFDSWFQFPENTFLLDEALQDVTDICVSHNHADHLDPTVLEQAWTSNPAITLHVPRYQTRWFAKRLAHLLPDRQDRICQHEAYECFRVAGETRMFFVPENSPGAVDAAMVCLADGQSLINLNDSRLHADQLLQIRQMTPTVDFLALPASGASEYPLNYTYTERELESRSVQKRRAKLEHCQEIIDLMHPNRVVFFAGPPVFLAPELRCFNTKSATSVFPDQLDIVQEMARDRPDIAARTLFLLPGEALQDGNLWPHTDLTARRLLPYTQKDAYIAAYAERRHQVSAFDWGEPADDTVLLTYFQHMATLSPYMAECIQGDICFVIKGKATRKVFTVDFLARGARQGLSAQPLYVLTAPASSVQAVLAGSATWDDVFLSFRMTFDERTERFVAHFKTLLRYMDAEIFTQLEQYEKRLRRAEEDLPMIEVTCGAETFRIQRRCPHAGTDLAHHGKVNADGTITCLAHRFCFDLRTGECTNVHGYQLQVGKKRGASTSPRI
jgi:UDP-MurNAc hydroxylase